MTTYLLAIGINQYTDRAFRALSCCENDATELHSLFKRNLDLGDRARKLVGAVSIADVKNELRRIGQEIRNGDTFVFFFAGHGYQHPRKEDQYLLFPDAEAVLVNKGHRDGMLALSALRDLTEHWTGVARVFILDACRSWLPGRGAEGARFDNEVALAYLTSRSPGFSPEVEESGDPTNNTGGALPPVILNATRNGDEARELEHLGRGILALAIEQTFEKQSRAGRPIWLNSATFADIGRHMQSLLQQGQLGVTQTPFMTQTNGQILLYKPEIEMQTNRQENRTDNTIDFLAPAEKTTIIAPLSGVPNPEERWQRALGAIDARDFKTATTLVNELVAESHPDATNLLAEWYAGGNVDHCVPCDLNEAKRLFERAAALGNRNAMYQCAIEIKREAGFLSIPEAAMEWLRRAAQSGHIGAAIDLYQNCLKQAETDLSELSHIASWLKTAMQVRPHFRAFFDLEIVIASAFCRQDLRRIDLAEMALDNWADLLSKIDKANWDFDDRCKLLVLRAWLFENSPNASSDHRKDAQKIYERLNELTSGDQPRLALEGFADSTHWGHNFFERNFTQETAFLRRSAEMGNPSSQFKLAEALWLGNTSVSVDSAEYGTGSDLKAASELLVAAADGGHAKAMIDLAKAYSDTYSYGVAQNLSLAEEWVRKAWALELDASQLASLAPICQDEILSVEIYRRCVKKLEEGDSCYEPWKVYFGLGMQLWAGIGVAQDRLEAERLFEKSVALHDAKEKNDVGRQAYRIAEFFCICADARYQDFDAARKWLIKSAEAGDQKAMLSLAGCLAKDYPHQSDIARLRKQFHNSQTFPEDKKQARYWLDRLVELGNRDAKFILALALLHGTPFGENAKHADALLHELEEGWLEAKDHHSMLKVASAWEQTANNGFSGADKAKYWRDLAERGAGAEAQYARALELEGESLNCLAPKFRNNASSKAQEAFRLMNSAACSGHFDAMRWTGLWLVRGYGAEASTQAAENCFERYAAQRPEDKDGWEADRIHTIADDLFKLSSSSSDTLPDALRWLKKACEAGSNEGLLDFAIVCGEGIGCGRDSVVAKRHFQQWLRRTHDSKKLLSKFNEAFLWFEHTLETRNQRCSDQTRVLAFEVIAEEGEPDDAATAIYLLGKIYRQGQTSEWIADSKEFKEAPPDFSKAYHYFKAAAEKNHIPAYEALAQCLSTGEGVGENQSAAQAWWLKAAESDSVSALIECGKRAFKGIGQAANAEQAQLWFQRAAKQSDDAPKRIADSIFSCDDPSTHRIAYEYRLQANQRQPDPNTMKTIASHLISGWGVPQNLDEADHWIEKAKVAAGDDWDACSLAADFWKRNGHPERAIRFLCESFEKGDGVAALELGEAYATGFGTSVDPGVAEVWFQRAIHGNFKLDRSHDAKMTLVYWWTRWGSKDRFSEASTWLNQTIDKDDMTLLAQLALLRATYTPKKQRESLDDVAKRLGFNDSCYTQNSRRKYRIECEIAQCILTATSLDQDGIDAARLHLRLARTCLEIDQEIGFYSAGAGETHYIERLWEEASLRKPKHWLVAWIDLCRSDRFR